MTKKATYDSDTGTILGFYDTDIHPSIPSPNISITDTQWQNILNNPNTFIVSSGVLTGVSSTILLQLAKTKKIIELGSAYYRALNTDITSSALGSSHIYKSDSDSQADLNSLIILGATATYLYFDNNGNPIATSHTLAQLQQVLTDLITAQQVVVNNYASKVASVNSASTVSAVNAVIW